MDSLKSIVVVAILLGVLYGIYQVINDENSPNFNCRKITQYSRWLGCIGRFRQLGSYTGYR